MTKEGNTKKERIEKLEKEFTALTESVSNIEDLENKPHWFVISVAIVSIIVSVVSGFMAKTANKEIDALQAEVSVLQDENNVLQANVRALSNPDATDTFIDTVIPMENRELYDKKGNTFYYDPDCKSAITNPIFCSREYITGKDSFGNSIRVYRLINGDFAYIPIGINVNLQEN